MDHHQPRFLSLLLITLVLLGFHAPSFATAAPGCSLFGCRKTGPPPSLKVYETEFKDILETLKKPHEGFLPNEVVQVLEETYDELVELMPPNVSKTFSMDTPKGQKIAQTILEQYQTQRAMFKNDILTSNEKKLLRKEFKYTVQDNKFTLPWNTDNNRNLWSTVSRSPHEISLQHHMAGSTPLDIQNAVDSVLKNLFETGSNGEKKLNVKFDTITTVTNVLRIVDIFHTRVLRDDNKLCQLFTAQMASRVLAITVYEDDEKLAQKFENVATAADAAVAWMLEGKKWLYWPYNYFPHPLAKIVPRVSNKESKSARWKINSLLL